MPEDPALDLRHLRREATRIAQAAGEAILAVYRGTIDVVLKDDASPLTRADLASHELVTGALRDLTPDIPILSEEAANEAPFSVRRDWQRFWLVDPLDGTKEFIQRNGEFTVNIALVDHGRAILGVVHAPALGLTYAAAHGTRPGRSHDGVRFEPIQAAAPVQGHLRVVASRSHAGAETQAFLDSLRVRHEVEVINKGSSLKICQVADGTADLYPRLGPTMEWDTAAAHAVASQAGAHVVALDGHPLGYNKPDLHNPRFLACAALPEPYLALLGRS